MQVSPSFYPQTIPPEAAPSLRQLVEGCTQPVDEPRPRPARPLARRQSSLLLTADRPALRRRRSCSRSHPRRKILKSIRFDERFTRNQTTERSSRTWSPSNSPTELAARVAFWACVLARPRHRHLRLRRLLRRQRTGLRLILMPLPDPLCGRLPHPARRHHHRPLSGTIGPHRCCQCASCSTRASSRSASSGSYSSSPPPWLLEHLEIGGTIVAAGVRHPLRRHRPYARAGHRLGLPRPGRALARTQRRRPRLPPFEPLPRTQPSGDSSATPSQQHSARLRHLCGTNLSSERTACGARGYASTLRSSQEIISPKGARSSVRPTSSTTTLMATSPPRVPSHAGARNPIGTRSTTAKQAHRHRRSSLQDAILPVDRRARVAAQGSEETPLRPRSPSPAATPPRAW